MGAVCGSCIDTRTKKEREYDQRRKKRNEQQKRTLTLLLLGAGESGKTTVMRQLMLLHGNNPGHFAPLYLQQMRPYVLYNVVEGANIIVKGTKLLNHPIQDKRAQEAATEVLRYCNATDTKQGLKDIPESIAESIKILLTDPDFLQTLRESSSLQIQDGWVYYMGRMREWPSWGGPGWDPSSEDILHARVRTVGIHTEMFTIRNRNYKVVDVGGQKTERKKWIQLFAGVHGLIYMQSLSDFDQVMFEDEDKNRFLDSLELWEKTVNNPAFVNSALILFLNKEDLLRKKFIENRIPIDPKLGTDTFVPPVYTSELTEEENVVAVIKWYRMYLFSKVKNGKQVFVHVTTALVKETMQRIVDAVFLQLVETLLGDVGFTAP